MTFLFPPKFDTSIVPYFAFSFVVIILNFQDAFVGSDRSYPFDARIILLFLAAIVITIVMFIANIKNQNRNVPDDILMDLLEKAYRIVLESLSKKRQKEILGDAI